MRVICPYTRLATETKASLDASGYPWEAVDVSGSSTAYADLLDGLWAKGETFCLVEHDMVPRDDTLKALDDCPEGWCGFVYRHPVPTATTPYQELAGLGCTRFRSELMARFPDMMTRSHANYARDGWNRRYWANCDERIYLELTRLAVPRHEHGPAITHLHTSSPGQQSLSPAWW
jgi:hypothetical protein